MEVLPPWQDALNIAPGTSGYRRATLKIVLKTKDETFHLKDWIDHHAGIVGFENLVILDNFSVDQDVLAVYDRYRSSIPIGSFGGFVDNPHNSTVFAELYDWLNATSKFYTLLDSDERLIFVDDQLRYFADERILEHLNAKNGILAFPGTWLSNQPGSRVHFAFGTEGGLIDNIRWGKPILSTKAKRPTTVVHNCQVTDLFDGTATNLMVLHLARLSVAQRFQANMNKLRSYGVISEGAPYAEVRDLDIDRIVIPALGRLVEETRKLAMADEFQKPDEGPTPHSIVLEGGNIHFFDKKQHLLFQELLLNPASFITKI